MSKELANLLQEPLPFQIVDRLLKDTLRRNSTALFQ
jgi:hypothetical protein